MISKYDPQSIGDEQRPLYDLIIAVADNSSKIPELVSYLEGAENVKVVAEGIASKKYHFKLADYFAAYLYAVIGKYCNDTFDQTTVMMVSFGLTEKYRNVSGHIPRIKLFYAEKKTGLQYALKHINPNREDMTQNIYNGWSYLKSLNLNDYVVERVDDLNLQLRKRTGDFSKPEPIIVLSGSGDDEYIPVDYSLWSDLLAVNPGLDVPEQIKVWVENCQTKLRILTDVGCKDSIYAAVMYFQLGECYRYLDDERADDQFEQAFRSVNQTILDYIQDGTSKEVDGIASSDGLLNVFCSLYRERASTLNVHFVREYYLHLTDFITRLATKRVERFEDIENLDAYTVRLEFEFINEMWNYYCQTAQFLADLSGRAILTCINLPSYDPENRRLVSRLECYYSIFCPHPYQYDWFREKFVTNPDCFERSLFTAHPYTAGEIIPLNVRPEAVKAFDRSISDIEMAKYYILFKCEGKSENGMVVVLPEKFSSKESVLEMLTELQEKADLRMAKDNLNMMIRLLRGNYWSGLFPAELYS